MPDSGAVGNVLKMAGEYLLPGASGLVDGNIKAGAGHTLLGLAGNALLGPAALLLVKANSYSYSVSEKHLHQHIMDLFSSAQTDSAASPSPVANS